MDTQEVADRLVECEQRLASLPESDLRLKQALAENAALRTELEIARGTVADLTSSSSWRLTEPLRRAQRLIRRR